MFRNWMRNRLGLDATPAFNAHAVDFQPRPVGGPETVFNPRAVGFENRPVGGPEGWTPKPIDNGPVDFQPRPVSNVEGVNPMGNTIADNRRKLATNPFMW